MKKTIKDILFGFLFGVVLLYIIAGLVSFITQDIKFIISPITHRIAIVFGIICSFACRVASYLTH